MPSWKKVILSGSDAALHSLNVTNGITGSLQGTSSYATISSQIEGGKATHIPYFETDTTLATSSLYQSGSSTVIINQDNATTANPEALYVWQPHPTSVNVISGKGNLDSFLQLNIQNTSQGTKGSSDVVATANNGSDTTNYIDMGINGENYVTDHDWWVGESNDTYLVSVGGTHYMGSAAGGDIRLFTTGSGFDGIGATKLLLRANNQHQLTGSLHAKDTLYAEGGATITGSLQVTQAVSATQGFTGSLNGNADTATSASYATNSTSASHAIQSDNATNAITAESGSNFVVTNTLRIDGSLTDYATTNSTIVGTNNLYTQATGSFTAAFCKYTVLKGANARAGEFMTVWNGSTVTYTDTSTTDIGNTSDISFTSAAISGNIQISTVAASSGWTIKTLVTYI